MAIPAIILPITLLILPLACLAGEPRSLTRSIDPIEVPGFEVPAFSGMAISRLRAIASRSGKLITIPFQIDQKDSNNDWVWNAVYEAPMANDWFDDESLAEADRHNNLTYDDQDAAGNKVFDDNDVIVFLAKDAGDKDQKSLMRLGAERLVELEISDPVNQGKGWVYLAYFKFNAPALSDKHYVRYEPEKLVVSGPEHEFLYSQDHVMMLEDFRLGGTSVFAGNRIRGEVEAGVGPITLDFEFSENNVKGYNAGYINGPVRVVKRSVEYVQLGPGITSPPVNCDHFHYPWHAEIPILISKHFPVRQLSILATSIFRESTFTRAEVEGAKNPIFLGIRPTHGNLLMDNTEAKWIALAGEGISIINSVKIPEKHKQHIEAYPYLVDSRDTSDSYDAKPAFGVEAGFMIRTTDKSPDADHIIHNTFLFTANSNREEYLASAIKLLRQKLVINAITLTQ